MQITVQLPDELARQLAQKSELPRRILEAVALEAYRAGDISAGQVGEMLALSFAETEEFLSQHKAHLHYSLDDLDTDRAALERILGAK